MKRTYGNPDANLAFKILSKAVDEMERSAVSVVDQRVFTLHRQVGIADFMSWRHVRIMLPKLRKSRFNRRNEPTRECPMQIPDSRGQHQNVAGGLPFSQEKFHANAAQMPSPNKPASVNTWMAPSKSSGPSPAVA